MMDQLRLQDSRSTAKPLWPVFFVLELFFKIGFIFVFAALLCVTVGLASYKLVSKRIQGDVVVVPQLVKEDVADALRELDKQGLYMALIRTEYGADSPVGVIIDQSPWPETKVKKGTPVRVTLSGGPSNVRVPSVKGMNEKQAVIRLEQQGLQAGLSSDVESSEPLGTVIASEPAADKSVVRGTKVNLLVSLGPPQPEISMPPLKGLSVSQATDALKELGLEIGSINLSERSDMPEDVILDQDPPAGNHVGPGQSISVTASKAPEKPA